MLWKKESNRAGALLVDLNEIYGDDSFGACEADDAKVKSDDLSNHYLQKAIAQCDARNWFEAIELFNQALCLSENDSIELGRIYAHRASCYMQLKLFDQCLVDIELAKANRCPLQFRPKLNKMVSQCGQKKNETQNNERFKPTLSFVASQEFPCAANVIQIEGNSERFFIAGEDIDIGKTIFMEDGFVSTTDERYKRCCICLATTTNLIPCKMCTDALFCRGICDTNDLHQIECNLPKSFDVDDDELLVIRSILKAFEIFRFQASDLITFVEAILSRKKQEPTELDVSMRGKYAIFLRNGLKMVNSSKEADDFDDEFFESVCRIYQTLLAGSDLIVDWCKLDVGQRRFLMHLIGHHVCAVERTKVNVATAQNDGTSVLPVFSSFFEHSCNPNTVLVTSDQSAVAVTIRPIQKNQKLTVSLLRDDQLNLPDFMRRMYLHKQFNMLCKCERCSKLAALDSKIWLSEQFKMDIENDSHFEHKMQKMRKKLTQQCVKYLSGQHGWCEDVSLAMSTYCRLLREKFYLNLQN